MQNKKCINDNNPHEWDIAMNIIKELAARKKLKSLKSLRRKQKDFFLELRRSLKRTNNNEKMYSVYLKYF